MPLTKQDVVDTLNSYFVSQMNFWVERVHVRPELSPVRRIWVTAKAGSFNIPPWIFIVACSKKIAVRRREKRMRTGPDIISVWAALLY